MGIIGMKSIPAFAVSSRLKMQFQKGTTQRKKKRLPV